MPAKAQRMESLPHSLPPFGVGRLKAAALFDISPSLFDRLVEVGQLPQPRLLGGRLVWDVVELGEAWRSVPHRREDLDALSANGNPWDE
ncbi:hypothetical protein [Brucella rhizosphaerae]|uniref:hypothetical protein n=1 Tax=Brucella rhizosphaerae TaxID=571254 RepID=UPI0004650C98|nr:hypothetical protein [Brucella rhizosphaerae]